MRNLFVEAKVTRAINGVAAGSTVHAGSILDTRGYPNVAFLAMFGTLTTGAVANLHAEMADTTETTDMVDVEDSAVAIDDNLQNGTVLLDLHRVPKRYIRPVVHRATANAVIDGVVAFQYDAQRLPVSHDTGTVYAATYLNSPTTGASTGS